MIKNCKVCNKDFVTYPSKINIGRGVYCSRECCLSLTAIKKGQRLSIATEIKKGDKLALGIKKESSWNSGTKGICKSNKTSFKPGEHVSPETEYKKGMPMHLHPRWEGGKSFEAYPLGWNNTFREQIRYRDGYQCQVCGKPEIEEGRKLSVHHINYDKKDLSLANLITLCISCHTRTNSNREYWQVFFKGGDSNLLHSASSRT